MPWNPHCDLYAVRLRRDKDNVTCKLVCIKLKQIYKTTYFSMTLSR